MFRRFETLCSILIGLVKKKKNWDEIARVFLQVKVWLKRNLGQSEGGVTRRGRVRIEEQAVKGNGPKWRSLIRQGCKGKKAPCRSEDEEPWDGSALSCFRRLSLFSLSLCRRAFQDLLKINPSSLFMLCGCISSSMASLMSPSM